MSNPNFAPAVSTNEIWRDQDLTRCLTDDLDAMDVDIAALKTGKADVSHTHSGYAAASDVTSLQNLVGDTSVSTQITNAISGYATQSYVNNQVSSLVDSAPETLNTLNELAAALGDDPNFATTIANQIGTKVTAVEGKGLSTNDYTTVEKNKLADIEAEANKTIIDSTLNTTSENPVQNKVIKAAIDAITAKTSVSVSVANDSLENFGKNCYYYPSFDIVLFRMYGITTQAMTAETSYTVASVSEHIPENNHALAIKCSNKAFSAIISSAGNINITPHINVSAGHPIYVTGFWFV